MRQPILVTGTHRSGSTWVGKMLSLSREIAYIHEPFNPDNGILKSTFEYWFTYANERLYKSALEDCISFNYPFIKDIKYDNSAKNIARAVRNKLFFEKNKILNKSPLVKDPIALLSADYLYKEFSMDVIVLIRHPAAFVGSLKNAGWTFPFGDFLEQPELMNKHLKKYERKIKKYAKKKVDIVDQGILLWNIFHEIILKYQDEFGDEWIFLRHEDLSREPTEEFELLYKKLDLNYTTKIKQKIINHSTANKREKSKLKRDSHSNIWSWKERLSNKEIIRVKKNTEELSSYFYSEQEW